MPRVAKDPQVRRLEMLQAADSLFNQQGYEQTTVEAITQRAGVAKGTFYLYFKSKADLLGQLMDWKMGSLFHAIDQQLAGTKDHPLEQLRAFHAASLHWKMDDWAAMKSLIQMLYMDENNPMRQRLNQAYIEKLTPLLAGVIGLGVEQGVFDVGDPAGAAEIILTLMVGLGDRLAVLLLTLEDHPENVGLLLRKVQSMEEAERRILGLSEETIALYDFDFGDILQKGMNRVP